MNAEPATAELIAVTFGEARRLFTTLTTPRPGRHAAEVWCSWLGQSVVAAGRRPCGPAAPGHSRCRRAAPQGAHLAARHSAAPPLQIPVPRRLGRPSQRFPRPWIVTTWVAG